MELNHLSLFVLSSAWKNAGILFLQIISDFDVYKVTSAFCLQDIADIIIHRRTNSSMTFTRGKGSQRTLALDCSLVLTLMIMPIGKLSHSTQSGWLGQLSHSTYL